MGEGGAIGAHAAVANAVADALAPLGIHVLAPRSARTTSTASWSQQARQRDGRGQGGASPTAYRDATAANDADALRAIHEPDARTWHNLDGLSVSVDDSARSLAWLHRRVPDLRLDDVRLVPTPEGFVVRWTMAGTAPGWLAPAALLRRGRALPAGKVARAAEYLDSAQLAVLHTS